MASRDIMSLVPEMQGLLHRFDFEMQGAGIEYLVTCTYRSQVEQDALYQQGRTKPGNIVTNAHGGQSAHNFGMAFDIVIMDRGKCVWSADDARWKKAGAIGRELGLKWGGDWISFREFPHFELDGWKGKI